MNRKIIFHRDGTESYFIDGQQVTQKQYDKLVPAKPIGVLTGKRSKATWPMKSDAMGINPNDAAEAEAVLQQAGIPTEFDRETGQAILTGPAHRKRLAEHYGFYDRNGGYGDPQRG